MRGFLFFGFVSFFMSCSDVPSSPEGTRILDGFEISLIAKEPLIKDPVDLEFDGLGNALVLEMPGYPYEDQKSKVKALIDKDHDGIYDDVTVFADGLELASSILPYNQGLLVAAPPYLLHALDEDGDLIADRIDTLMGGFSTGNLQHNYNGLTFGIDGWIYAANGGNSGEPYWWGNPEEKLSLRGQDFRINLVEKKIERLGQSSGGFELAVDHWGKLYETHNLTHISQLVFPGRYLENTPLNIEHTLVNVSDHDENGLARIYPIGEQESRVNHPEQSGYFSGACGITFYGGNAFRASMNNTVWLTDVVLNLLHVDQLKENGSQSLAMRVVEKMDFYATVDRSSRPVNLTVGPDGSMYMVDMYREVIEHPEWIPDDIEATLDLNAGKDKGRIYKIIDHQGRLHKPITTDLSDPAKRVQLLSHPNQWVRNTAHRLLLENKLSDFDVQSLQEMLKGDNAYATLHAMWILNAQASLNQTSLQSIIADNNHPDVVENAIRVAESHKEKAAFIPILISLLDDARPRVRMQAGLTLSTYADGDMIYFEDSLITAFANVLQLPNDNYTIASTTLATKSCTGNIFSKFFQELHLDKNLMASMVKYGISQKIHSQSILSTLANQSVEDSILAVVLEAISTGEVIGVNKTDLLRYINSLESGRSAVILAVLAEIRQDYGLPPSETYAKLSKEALVKSKDNSLPDATRLEQLALIESVPYEEKRETLYSCLKNTEGIAIQETVLKQLWESTHPEIGRALVERWKDLGPSARKAASDILLYKETHHDALLTGLEDGTINIGEMNFDLERRRTLLWWTDNEDTKKRAEALFSDSGVQNRKEVIDSMQYALSLAGNVEAGSSIFQSLCANCHIYSTQGVAVGPNLTEINRKSKASLIHDILDPNAAVDTKYINHRINTIDGKVYLGIVGSETDENVTLIQLGGQKETIAKKDIADFISLGTSFMMEGLEANMSHQDLADLLAYITQETI